MKLIFKTAFAVGALLCSACSSEKTNSAISQAIFNPEKNGYTLVFEDQFEGDTLSNYWKIRGVGPRRIGYNAERTVQVKDGCLNLMFDMAGDSILGSAVCSKDYYQYGYFEIRAQLQESIGPWAAFWMQSDQISKGEDPAQFGAEIDIFEYFNELGADTLTHAIHWAYGPNQKTTGRMDSYLKGLNEGFHTFALEWTPEKYAFYIDGLKFQERTDGLSHIKEYIILSMEFRSSMEQMKAALPQDNFQIDYIKVYQKTDK